MNTLFGQDIIKSIGFDEGEILRNIFELHCPGGIDLDPCYSVGRFYADYGIKKPKYKFDKTPQHHEVLQGASDNIPLDPGSVNSVMFDPPFVIGGEVTDGEMLISRRFTSFQSFGELKTMYGSSLKEFARVLKEDGVLIFKCQDCVAGGKQYFSHCWIMNEALKHGFYPKDLFILLVKNRILGGADKVQQHARKFHSYYWVFVKKICKVNYETLQP